MANLTLAIDDALLRRARMRALEQGTSVNALLRTYLTSYADSGAEAAVRRELADMARQSVARSDPEADVPGYSWTRDELHDRSAG